MRISQLKKQFSVQLEGEFPSTEIMSFFYILTEEYLGMQKVDIALNPTQEISKEEQTKFESALNRLKKHEPIQYITGNTEFFTRKFLVNKSVLIPRPETEELVEWIISDHRSTGQELKILDIGTGSGCIPISLAKELEDAKVSSFDISSEALLIAKRNAKLNAADVLFRKLNILEAEELEGQFDIIVSNPPYVRELEKKEMHQNVLDHEPKLALYVEDENALIFYKKIAELAVKSLNPAGCLYFEINQYLAEETKSLVQQFGFETELKKDIFGHYRMLKATKQ
ncbi:peptide chain release factor N(5)-glutamine methyltransferase [Christiangramia forsetii]|uniref:Release factor glutamine methyltransferase n=2 Tax=Christiangramia forsetii TaxID=411153 RepID=A0LZ20_CHRFK|nr:peptide chain release factor N(5)-glutamine methyltransferase [Christiangramia forsetii]GGG37204.1 release factor glutamine methyltransferase [Christiangramia forsetii]CAL65615.1 modification methylase HemK [Christiangramia forsetii KT0803]